VHTHTRGWLIPSLFFILAITLSACGKSNKTELKEIKIEDEVITQTPTPAKAIVVTEFLESKKKTVSKLSQEFASHFRGGFTIDNAQTNKIGQLSVPTLKHNGQSLYADHTIPDKISAQHMAVATVFVKSGDDYVRIATSVKKEDGGRAFGTTLDRRHPGYKKVLLGEPYSGTATLFGMIYMTEYSPIKDAAGNLVGILFVGMDITADLIPLKAQLR